MRALRELEFLKQKIQEISMVIKRTNEREIEKRMIIEKLKE
jgi:hypothetical protein